MARRLPEASCWQHTHSEAKHVMQVPFSVFVQAVRSNEVLAVAIDDRYTLPCVQQKGCGMCWRLTYIAQAIREEPGNSSWRQTQPLQTCDALRPQDPTRISWMMVWLKPQFKGAGSIGAQWHVSHKSPSQLQHTL